MFRNMFFGDHDLSGKPCQAGRMREDEKKKILKEFPLTISFFSGHVVRQKRTEDAAPEGMTFRKNGTFPFFTMG